MEFLWRKNVFLSQNVDGKMVFTDYWKVLVLKFSVVGNTVFFGSRSWWKDGIYWLPRSSCFELFGHRKYDLFFSQKVDGKMIFTWSFWAFHDIPGPGKYGFSCSEKIVLLFGLPMEWLLMRYILIKRLLRLSLNGWSHAFI